MTTSPPVESPFTLDDCERHIARVWAELLQYPGSISSATNFFEVGGDSLALMMMLFQVGESYQIEIQPWSFIEQPTLGALCKRVCMESPRNGSTVADRPATAIPQEGYI